MNLRVLGTVVRSHGLKGAFRLNIAVEDAPQLEENEPVFILLQGGPVPFFIHEFSFSSKTSAVMKLDDVDALEAAERLIGKEILLPAERFAASDDQDTLEDLMDFEVYDIHHGLLGRIVGIMHLPQQSILQVFGGKKEILIPAVKEIVTEIDLDLKKVVVDTPDGLVDLYLNG